MLFLIGAPVLAEKIVVASAFLLGLDACAWCNKLLRISFPQGHKCTDSILEVNFVPDQLKH